MKNPRTRTHIFYTRPMLDFMRPLVKHSLPLSHTVMGLTVWRLAGIQQTQADKGLLNSTQVVGLTVWPLAGRHRRIKGCWTRHNTVHWSAKRPSPRTLSQNIRYRSAPTVSSLSSFLPLSSKFSNLSETCTCQNGSLLEVIQYERVWMFTHTYM